MSNEQINKHVEDAMNSLDGIQRAEPAPYLLTRINARLANGTTSVWDTIGSFISRPSVMVSGLCLILLLNVTAVLQNKSYSRSVDEQLSSTAGDDYSAGFTTIDNIENIEP